MVHKDFPAPRPLLFGEVMLDQEGGAVIGGAPFNVAWHLQGFGLHPLLVTRVGEDAAGDLILQAMREWGMETDGVQIDSYQPTASLRQYQETAFGVPEGQACDHIEVEPAMALLDEARWSIFYHGTLAARTPENWATLLTIRAASDAPVFADAHRRDLWWETEQVQQLLVGARWLKLDRRELLDLSGTVMDDEPTVAAAARELLRRYGLAWLIVTDGKSGARFHTDEQSGYQPAIACDRTANPLAAGDAFSAVCMLGLTFGWSIETTLARAGEFAATIGSEPGAVSADRALYEHWLDNWRRI